MDDHINMNNQVHHPVVYSMLWSAYADALGFITEMVDQSGLKSRTGQISISETIPWSYRIGGRYGTEVQLPSGMYSDDTQLRLATARAIGAGGEFNIEAFTKIELPVWLSYALGGGKATKAAAANLARDNITWYSNFYSSSDTQYFESGGNGAAMRVQPHVWATAPNFDIDTLMLNVARNTISTHGHARALVGALLHALVLADVQHNSELPPPDRWVEHLERIRRFPHQIALDDYLGVMWLTAWERRCGRFVNAIAETVAECIQDIDELKRAPLGTPESEYLEFLRAIGGFDRAIRGSGTKTALAALALAWMFRREPAQAVLTAANALGSDTDTIGTMAGALLGIIAREEPPGMVCDRELLIGQAERLIHISTGARIQDFSYPSLLGWKPPRNASDSVGRIGGGYGIAGLGFVTPIDSKTYVTNEKQPASFRWMRTSFGQTILVKMRHEPRELSKVQMPAVQAPLPQPAKSPRLLKEEGSQQEDRAQHERLRKEERLQQEARLPKEERLQQEARLRKVDRLQMPNSQESFLSVSIPRRQETLPLGPSGVGSSEPYSEGDLDALTQAVIRSGFDPMLIGETFIALCNGAKAIEKSIAFAAILAKAKTARRIR